MRNSNSGGAQNDLADSRSISVINVVPNMVFVCGKYRHCKMLRDNKHGPDFLLKSVKNVCRIFRAREIDYLLYTYFSRSIAKPSYQCVMENGAIDDFARLFRSLCHFFQIVHTQIAIFDFGVTRKGRRQYALIHHR